MSEHIINRNFKPLLPVPPDAKEIHGRILELLRSLLGDGTLTPSDPGFQATYLQAMELYQEYQQAVVAHSGYRMECRSGCYICCCHWADDIYSFEAEILTRHLLTLPAAVRKRIISDARRSVRQYREIKKRKAGELTEEDFEGMSEEWDPEEIVLNEFYRLKSRCPLLDEDNRCMVYSLRPLTCRAYINLGNAALCPPEMINENDTVTYILDLDDEANELLDELHFRFERFPGDSALRSLVLKYLTE